MNIAVCAGNLFSPGSKNNEYPITEMLSKLGLEKQEHLFFLISGIYTKADLSFSSNFETINTGSQEKRGLIKNLFRNAKLSRILKKLKAEILISFDGHFSLSLKIPQIVFVTEGSKIKGSSLKKAKMIAVISQWQKSELVKRFKIKEEKIETVFAFANEFFKPTTESAKEKIKEKYCEGKEYFLFPEKNINSESFINILKSFSHFKKRTQSGMKLMLLSSPGEMSLKSLLSYKYKNDVVITENITAPEEADITGSSYALLISPTTIQPVLNTLNAFQCEIPVIAAMHPAIQEIAGEAVLYAANESGKEMGEKMIRIYTDEKLRAEQIKKGEEVVKNYTAQKTADLLWNCIQTSTKMN